MGEGVARWGRDHRGVEGLPKAWHESVAGDERGVCGITGNTFHSALCVCVCVCVCVCM